MKKLALAFCLLGLLSFTTFAASTLIGTSTVKEIQILGAHNSDPAYAGYILFVTSNGKKLYISANDVNLETYLSLLLSARTKGLYIAGFYESNNHIFIGGSLTYYELTNLYLL
jgi:hypothetical protein